MDVLRVYTAVRIKNSFLNEIININTGNLSYLPSKRVKLMMLVSKCKSVHIICVKYISIKFNKPIIFLLLCIACLDEFGVRQILNCSMENVHIMYTANKTFVISNSVNGLY